MAVSKPTLEDFRNKTEVILGKVSASLQELGSLILEAEATLLAKDYNELIAYLEDLGFGKQEVLAAIEVARGNLAPELFFIGVSVGKVLKLSDEDQSRLINGEVFELKQHNADNVSKTWGQMSVKERNQLLGNSGRILSSWEQTVSGNRGSQTKTTQYTHAKLDVDVLRLSNGERKGEIQFGALAATLSVAERIRLVEALQA